MDINIDAVKRNITKYRIMAKLNQKQLAARIGVSSNYISAVETKKGTVPSMDVIFKIAEAVNVTPDQLMYECLDYFKSSYDDSLIDEISKELQLMPLEKISFVINFLKAYNKNQGLKINPKYYDSAGS